MKKIYLLSLYLLFNSFHVHASIITHQSKQITDSGYIFDLSQQQYSDKYQRTMLLLKSGQLEQAKKSLAQQLTLNPFDPEALDLSGNILLAEGKTAAALNAYQRALAQNSNPNIMAKIGISHLLLKEYPKARLFLTQAVSLSPYNILALRYLAWMEGLALNTSAQLHYLSQMVKYSNNINKLSDFHVSYLTILQEQGNAAAVLSFIENQQEKIQRSAQAIKDDIALLEIEAEIKTSKLDEAKIKFSKISVPKQEDEGFNNYTLLKVFLLASTRNYKEAEATINSLTLSSETYKIAVYSLAKTYFDHNNAKMATQLIVGLLDNEKNAIKQLSYTDDLVAIYVSQSRYRDAINLLRDQIKKNSKVPNFHFQLAEVYIVSGREKQAIQQLEYVIKNFPTYQPGYISMGRQLIKKGDKDAISNFYSETFNNHPKTPELWFDYAKYLTLNEDYTNAIKIFERSLEHLPNNPMLTFELATLYDLVDRLVDSKPLYLSILGQYPEYLPALDNLATNLFALEQDIKNAVVLSKRAFMLSPDDIFIKNLRAQAYIAENDSKQAIALLEPIAEQFKQSGLAQLTLAQAYEKLGKKKEAIEHVTLALKHDLPKRANLTATELKNSLSK